MRTQSEKCSHVPNDAYSSEGIRAALCYNKQGVERIDVEEKKREKMSIKTFAHVHEIIVGRVGCFL